MSPESLFTEGPSNTREAIMQATYETLRDHGYAALSMSRIADKLEMTKSSLYYHFDGKDDLLLEFLDFVLERWNEEMPSEEHQDPHARLRTLINTVLPQTLPDRSSAAVIDDSAISEALVQRAFAQTYIELRMQASHDDEFRAHFTENDLFFRNHLISIIQSGIDEGLFRDVDPERAASLIQSVVEGTLLRRVTADDESGVQAARAELEEYIQARLLPGTV